MTALLLLAVLAQSQVREENPWRTQRADGSVCVRVTQESGEEIEECRKPGHAFGAVPVDQSESNPVVDEAPVVDVAASACPPDTRPGWAEAPDAEKAQMLRDCRVLAAPVLVPVRARVAPAPAAPAEHRPEPRANLSRYGFVGNLVGKLDQRTDSVPEQGYGIQARAGVRYGLLDRSRPGNVALSVLVGGGFANGHGTVGVDSRIEGMLAGEVAPLTPVVMGYFTSGVTFSVDPSYATEFHVGVGTGWNLIASGYMKPFGDGFDLDGGPSFGRLLGGGNGIGAIFVIGVVAIIGAAIVTYLVALMSTAELRYTLRTDGTHYGSVVFGIGI
jgi:hypothetical protein